MDKKFLLNQEAARSAGAGRAGYGCKPGPGRERSSPASLSPSRSLASPGLPPIIIKTPKTPSPRGTTLLVYSFPCRSGSAEPGRDPIRVVLSLLPPILSSPIMFPFDLVHKVIKTMNSWFFFFWPFWSSMHSNCCFFSFSYNDKLAVFFWNIENPLL